MKIGKYKLIVDNKGFSFVEIMIVIAIIGIMTSITLVSLMPSKNAESLNAAAREVASAIKLAQSYALQGKVVQISGINTVPCGYGFIFPDNGGTNYGIFYNYNPSYKCKLLNDDNDPNYVAGYRNYGGSSVIVEPYSLQKGVVVNSINGDTNGTDFPLNSQVYYTVPHGNAYYTLGIPMNSDIIIELKLSDQSRYVIIHPGGSVEEKNSL